MSDFIMRHEFKDENESKNKERLKLGTTTAGVLLDITSEGLSINGYYKTSQEQESTYGILRKPLFISWEDVEKLRSNIKKKKPGKTIGEESPVTKEYLNNLPKVHINNIPYYIDTEKKEIRPIKTPNMVFKLET